MSNFKAEIQTIENLKIKFNEPLGPCTTWKIGGNAEILIETKNTEELEKVLILANKHEMSFTILGKGSNVLISDNGIANLTIINTSKNILIQGKNQNLEIAENPYIPHRHSETQDKEFYSFADLDFVETGQKVEVIFDSGVFLPLAINTVLKNGLTGLQWFAGIPGSLGGSLYNNIHGGTRHFSDYFLKAKVFLPKNSWVHEQKIANNSNLDIKIIEETDKYLIFEAGFEFFNFGYDQSLLREKNTQMIILKIHLNLFLAPLEILEKARFTALEWAKRKRLQPQKSCGSVFQCLNTNDQQRLNYPTASAGYVIDKILNLRGETKGGAMISKDHANFIVNEKNATADDVLFLMKEIKQRAKKELNLDLIPEINHLGFTKEEILDIWEE
jgi:UDP-N-acetylmuramate dehydrogenase